MTGVFTTLIILAALLFSHSTNTPPRGGEVMPAADVIEEKLGPS